MTRKEAPLFIVDVDLTIYDNFAERPRLFPGTEMVLSALCAEGEVHLWSAGGRAHCVEVARRFDIARFITDYHAKPDFPPKEEEAIRTLGRKASLQIDDDPKERVGDWPFILSEEAQKIYGPY